MSIDNIPLPAFLYQRMFGKTLVEIPDLPFLGGNEKKITFLFKDDKHKFLEDSQSKFVSGLLSACELGMKDVALVNFSHNPNLTYRELLTGLQAKKILIFGISPEDLDLPFAIPHFQMQHFQDQVYMMSPPIEELQLNTDLKRQLWVCLQKIFNIRKQK